MLNIADVLSTTVYCAMGEAIDLFNQFKRDICNGKCKECLLSEQAGIGQLTLCQMLQKCNKIKIVKIPTG